MEIQIQAVLVLAAGRGTRMNNALPKVLHPLAGWPLLRHVLLTASRLEPAWIGVVVAADGDEVARQARAVVPDAAIVVQDPPRGTGDSVACARDRLPPTGTLLVLYGDTPLLRPDTLARLCARRQEAEAALAVLAFRPADPSGYGRLRLGADGTLEAIVEERHADPELLREAPCNAGVMAIDLARLAPLLEALEPHAEGGELYLTDLVRLARARGWPVVAAEAGPEEGLGANSQRELARLEALFQHRRRDELLAAGVVLQAPETVYVAADTVIEPGARIGPYVVFGPGVRVESDAEVLSFSHLEGAVVERGARIGPFARLRPGTRIGPGARIGNFVEAKNAVVEEGAKANHLAYLGDVRVGARANVGAGTITCNYDGVAKHRTDIGEEAFIGSNSALVAPVRVGRGAIVGAGSTIVQDVPADALAIARARQSNLCERAPRWRARARARAARGGDEGAGA